jgi:hypothetical protein
MKKLVLSLLCAGATAISGSALALPTQSVYNAFVVTGSGNVPVGQLVFDLDADIPGQACRYFYEWDNTAFLPLSADGYVLEAKVQGHASCISNALTPFTTSVTNDPHFPSFGFDRFQQFHSVTLLNLGENGSNGAMNGVIQYGPPGSPSTMVNSFKLKVAP